LARRGRPAREDGAERPRPKDLNQGHQRKPTGDELFETSGTRLTMMSAGSGENSGGTNLMAQLLSPDVLAARPSQGLTPPPAVPCGQP
jgi:hypothetical protein